ncbi:MAG: type II secretion system F family protein [Phycisphaerales bacterium]|nr:type II secretion system F family protein [Phycisphaerales bacterium]
MKLSFQAYDRAGRTVSGSVEAGSLEEARAKLRQNGMYVTELTTGAIAVASRGRGGLPSLKRLKGMSLLARQLSLLISTGTPLVEALGAIERQMRDPRWKAALADIRSRVEDGAPLSEAFAAHPTLFNPVACSLVRAGESSGGLEKMLDRMARLARQQEKVTSAILGSMLYPAVLMVVSVCVLVLMLTFVLPRFTTMFEALDAPLPATTEALLLIGQTMRGYWWAFPPVLIGGGFGAYQLFRSPRGRVWLEHLMLDAPLVGKIVKSLLVARIVRLLGVLLEARVPLLEALQLTEQSVSSSRYALLLSNAGEDVSRGEPLSKVFATEPAIPPAIVESVANGERTGRLGPVLSSLAEFMDEDNETLVKSISSIIEPVILVGLGVVVGFVAISMFLPLFDLTTMTQGTPKG